MDKNELCHLVNKRISNIIVFLIKYLFTAILSFSKHGAAVEFKK